MAFTSLVVLWSHYKMVKISFPLDDDDDDDIAVMEPKFKMVVVGGGATGRTAERESAGPPPQVSPDLVWSAILNLALVSYLIFRFSEF